LIFGSLATAVALYFLGSFLVIRSKDQSSLWLILAVLGPLGFAILSVLNDRAPSRTDRYSRFTRSLNWFLRAGYEILSFVVIWELSWQLMILKRNLMIRYESITTGVSTAQIIATQNASSGMWAFGEGIEVMFFVILLYLLRPIAFTSWPVLQRQTSVHHNLIDGCRRTCPKRREMQSLEVRNLIDGHSR
jgi:hypothetical protein